jgi:hypothetical protein
LKKIFAFIFYTGCIGLSAQTFNGRLIEKKTSEGIMDAYVFMIDPVDSSVIGFTQTDWNGYYHFEETVKPLRSDQYLLKIADFYLPDTSFLFKDDRSFRMLELERLQVVDWVAVNYDWVVVNYLPELKCTYDLQMDYKDWVYHAAKSCQDSSQYYYQKMLDSMHLAYNMEYEAWDKEYHRRDSLIKSGDEQMDIGPPPPVEPWYSDIVFEEIIVEAAQPVDGWKGFLYELMNIRSLRKLFKSHKMFFIEFTLADHSMEVLSDVRVFDSKDKLLKLPKQVYTDFKNVYPTHWLLGKINGRIFRHDPGVKYRIQFRYQAN